MNRVAILGAGIGAQHLDGFRACPELWEVALIVDRDLQRAQALTDGPVASDIAQALSDPSIDVIDICLPPHLHVPVAIEALSAGKHVICEKPIAMSLADIGTLRKAQETSGKTLFPVFQYRFGPALHALDALRQAGLTGNPLLAVAETHWARGSDYYAIDWRGTWAGEQGGAILGHAIHAHDLIGHFAAPVKAVSAVLTTNANPIETEDCAALSFTLEGGALASSSVTLGAAGDETRLRFIYQHLTATSGAIPYAPATGQWQFTARDPDQQDAVDECAALAMSENAPAGFEGAFREIALALSNAPNSAVTFNDGARSIELVSAIYAAARSGQRIDLPLSPSHPLHTGWQP